MRTTKIAVSILFTFLLGLVGSVGIAAQDATPVASPEGECAVLSEEELTGLAEDYLAAVEAEDLDAVEALLHDDVTHNLTALTGGANEPGNEDELAQFEAIGAVDYTVHETFASEDSVALRYTFSIEDIYGGSVEETALAVFRFECGQIIEHYQESTGFGMFLGGLGAAEEATPAP